LTREREAVPRPSERGLTSVIVVTANSGPLASRCVERVLSSNAEVELILVDNASRDGQVERIADRFAADPRLSILRNEANIGFGPACNRGAALARGDALLFLNPDCLIEADTIAGLCDQAQRYSDVGVLGVRVLDAGGKVETASRRRDPTLRRSLNSLTGLSRFAHRFPASAGIDMPEPSASTGLEPVDAISGACMFVPRNVYDRLGGFDEGYFLHCEDLDLCRRARDAGLAVLYVPTLSVRHEQGSSSFRRPLFVSRHKHRGMWRYFRKFDPAASNPVLAGLVFCGIWLHFALLAPMLAWSEYCQRSH
jgi:N-acetylglucosaminyl-diphospho-decaprenol L-rhamnosyltransferase